MLHTEIKIKSFFSVFHAFFMLLHFDNTQIHSISLQIPYGTISCSRREHVQIAKSSKNTVKQHFFALLRAALITSGADLLGRSVCVCVCLSGIFVILPRRKTRGDRVQFSSVLWPEKRVTYFSGPKSYPQLRTFKGYRTTVRGSENWTIFLDTFLHFFCFKISVFFTPPSHVS